MNSALSDRNRVQRKMGHTLRFGAIHTQRRNEMVSSRDTAIVSTHQSMTQSPPLEIAILEGGIWGKLISVITEVPKFCMRSSNPGEGVFWASSYLKSPNSP